MAECLTTWTEPDAEAIARGRELVANATSDRLDEIAAHGCGVADVAIASLSALEAALGALDDARRYIVERRASVQPAVESFGKQIRDLQAENDTLRRIGWGVVANAGRRSERSLPRWSHVMDATGLGSTSSKALCREHGFDPDEDIVGLDENGERNVDEED